MGDFSKYLMYIPGIVIFLVASGQVRNRAALKRKGALKTGTVRGTEHVKKNDRYGRPTFDYYDTEVELPADGSSRKQTVKVSAPVEYRKGQPLTLFFGDTKGTPTVATIQESLFSPWLSMVGGALLILLALFQIQEKQIPAMACLAAVMLGAGAGMIANCVYLRKKGLQPVDAKVIDIYKRLINR